MTPQATPALLSACPETNLWCLIDRFWDEIFLKIRGSVPTAEERPSTRLHAIEAIKTLMSEVGERPPTGAELCDALKRASQQINMLDDNDFLGRVKECETNSPSGVVAE